MPSKKKPARKRKTVRKKRTTKSSGPSAAQLRAQLDRGEDRFPWPLRPMQQMAYDKLEEGVKRFGLFWHRRAGKDVFGMSVARDQMRQRVGTYVHFFPKHVHAKRALWRGIDPRKGAKFIDIAFGDLEIERNNQDMLIETANGSTWALMGSDNYDSNVIGGNVVGVVFSEWALCNPKAWEYIRPILRENGGWAMFITTFRGRNHAWQMAQHLQGNPDWYIDIRDITRTSELDGTPIISEADVEKDREEGMPESLIQQEYYCNPEAVADGAIYGKQVEALRDDKSRHNATWQPRKPVYCVWNFDLPVFAACVFIQDGNVLAAETYSFTTLGEALAGALQKPYPIQHHLIHHSQRDIIAGLHDLNIHPEVLAHDNALMTTTATQNFLATCQVKMDTAEAVLDALGGYIRRERFSEQSADIVYGDRPELSSHAQLAQALETYCAWDYNMGNREWSKLDYSTHDRIARTII